MDEFNHLCATNIQTGDAAIHGLIAKCVDKTGRIVFSHVAGTSDIAGKIPLREDAVLKVASATKLMTSIALLQCVERGQIGLDESVFPLLPELDGKIVLEGVADNGDLISRPSTNAITPRQLLSHTSGLGYRFLHPLLMRWGTSVNFVPSNVVTKRYNTPLVFEPGQGWCYGSSLDWAGVLISRLNGGISLEEYMVEHLWKPLDLQAPFPTFHISRYPEYLARLMEPAQRTSEGGLKQTQLTMGDNPEDEEGGAGLAMTAADYLAVLQDLVSDRPRLLKSATVDLMFEPQLASDSEALSMLHQMKPAWNMVVGPIDSQHINHGLGGAVITGSADEISQPANLLVWGGATNIAWFISREHGIAGFFGTQLTPFADPKVDQFVNAWKKSFWSGYLARSADSATVQ